MFALALITSAQLGLSQIVRISEAEPFYTSWDKEISRDGSEWYYYNPGLPFLHIRIDSDTSFNLDAKEVYVIYSSQFPSDSAAAMMAWILYKPFFLNHDLKELKLGPSPYSWIRSARELSPGEDIVIHSQNLHSREISLSVYQTVEGLEWFILNAPEPSVEHQPDNVENLAVKTPGSSIFPLTLAAIASSVY